MNVKTSMMKKLKFFLYVILAFGFMTGFAACGMSYPKEYWGPDARQWDTGNEYNEITENPFVLTSDEAVSYFSMDNNTAAYTNIRRYINEGRAIDKNQVRIEEMVNYFRYGYDAPEGGEPLAINGTVSYCPWNDEAKLLTVGVRAKDIEFEAVRNNLVFLMDISGSMDSPDKMPLMQAAFCMLSDNLNDDDYVSIVAYAGADRVVLQGARGYERKRIQNAVEDLMASGSTAGAQGIKTAYALAEEYFLEGGNNRIILATDGDFNVGISSQSALEKFIKDKRQARVGLTILGFGYGNLKDNKLETLANAAFEGNYAYIDNILEAKKVLVDEIGGTLVTVARDVKASVEFNPAKVRSYRLLGYENKLLTQKEWDDTDTVAGDIGAGHCVTAVYEIILNSDDDTDDLPESATEENYLKIFLRYKDPDVKTGDANREISASVDTVTESPNDDVLFISAVVEAALVMRNSVYKGTASLQNVIARLQSIQSLNGDPYKAEFLELMIKLGER